MQEVSSGLALQACLRHSHQALKSFSTITLSYFKMREELSFGQIPLATIYAPLFCNASTFPDAFHSFSSVPASVQSCSQQQPNFHQHSPPPLRACPGPSLIPLPKKKPGENIETSTTKCVVLPILSRGEAMLFLRDLPLWGPTVGPSFPPTDRVRPSSCRAVQPLAPGSAGSNNQTGTSGPEPQLIRAPGYMGFLIQDDNKPLRLGKKKKKKKDIGLLW